MKLFLCNLQQSKAIPILKALNAMYCMLTLETIQHTCCMAVTARLWWKSGQI